MKSMKRSVITLAGTAAGVLVATIAFGQGQGEDPIRARKEMMKTWGGHAGALNRMNRGQENYDQAKVDAALRDFSAGLQRLPALFGDDAKPRGPSPDEYAASPKIWEDKAGFQAQAAKFAQAVEGARGKITNAETLKANFPGMIQNCNSCHETYRLKVK